MNKEKSCKINRLSKDRAWCEVHNLGYNPQLFAGKLKECPEKCQCISCLEMRKFLNKTHWRVPQKTWLSLAKEMVMNIHLNWGGTK